MAMTAALAHRGVPGSTYWALITLTFAANDYVTGGYAITAAALTAAGAAMGLIDWVVPVCTSGQFVAALNASTGKLQMFTSSAGALAEVANAGDVSACTVTLLAKFNW